MCDRFEGGEQKASQPLPVQPQKSPSWIGSIGRISPNQLKCNYLRNNKIFSILCCIFLIWIKFLIFSEKRSPSYLMCYETAKEAASWMSKKFNFRTSFNSQDAKRSQSLQKSPAKNFYHNISCLTGKFSCNVSLLVISKILGLFVNILTADDKYFLRNSENLRQPITMQLFKKQIFITNTEISIKLETALKKDKPLNLFIFKVRYCKRRG